MNVYVSLDYCVKYSESFSLNVIEHDTAHSTNKTD